MDKERQQSVAAPTPGQGKESFPRPEELLNKEMAAAQVLLLLGTDIPPKGTPFSKINEPRLESAAKESLSDLQRTRINNASLLERRNYWKKDRMPPEKRLDEWESTINTYLTLKLQDGYKHNLLKRIIQKKGQKLDEVIVNSKTIYQTLIIDQKGDVEYFARRLDRDDLKQHAEFIQEFAHIYGENSSKIAKLIAEGIANWKEQPVDLIASAKRELSATERSILETMDMHSQDKEKEDKQRTPTEPTIFQSGQIVPARLEPQQLGKPEEQKAGAEPEQMVEDVGVYTEKDHDDDRYFTEPEHGAFGVFDGMGSYDHSAEAAQISSDRIQSVLTRRDPPRSRDQVIEEIKKVFEDVSADIAGKIKNKYEKIYKDINEYCNGKVSEDEFEKNYPGWSLDVDIIKRILIEDRGYTTFPDEIPDDLIQINPSFMAKVKMYTTADVVKLWQSESGQKEVIIAHAGDSRVYHYKEREGKLDIATIDNNYLYQILGDDRAKYVQLELGRGKKLKEIFGDEEIVLNQSNPVHKDTWGSLSLADKDKYPWGQNGEVKLPIMDNEYLTTIDNESINRSVPLYGKEPVIISLKVDPGDRIILSTDGIHDNMIIKELEEIMRTTKTSQEVVEAIKRKLEDIKELNKRKDKNQRRSYKEDDKTFVIFRIK